MHRIFLNLFLMINFLGKIISPTPVFAQENIKEYSGLWGLNPGRAPIVQQSKMLTNLLENNPYLDGIAIWVAWKDIEPQEGQYDFSPIEVLLEPIRKNHKKVLIRIIDGPMSPEWLYETGVRYFISIDDNPRHRSFQKEEKMPVPWDDLKFKYWARLIRVLGKRYDTDPVVVAVGITGCNSRGPEMHLPRPQEEREKMFELGLSEEVLVKSWERLIDLWAENFPHCRWPLALSPTIGGSFDQGVLPRIVQYGIEHYPQNFSVMTMALHGRSDMEGFLPYDLVVESQNTILTGFQSVSAFTIDPERQGDMDVCLMNFLRAGGQFWELWVNDSKDTELCKTIKEKWQEGKRKTWKVLWQELQESGRLKKKDTYQLDKRSWGIP